MVSAEQKRQQAEANRRRYEELRAAGQEATPKGLPQPTPRDGAPISGASVISREDVPAGWYTTVSLSRGEAIRIIDGSGLASVSLIGWRRENPSERINCADTIKVQWSAVMSKGRVMLSDMGHVFLSLIEDTSGAHDLMVGGSTATSTRAAFGTAMRNTRDNFLAAAAKNDLSLHDIPPCVTFFAPVSVDAGGRFQWNEGCKQPGDFVDLRAEMNLLLALSNCAHPLNPARPAATEPITLIRFRPQPAAADEFCRTASPEAARAFEFTDRLYI
jgi:uncharacterized protein